MSNPAKPRSLGTVNSAGWALTGETGDGYLLVSDPWFSCGLPGGTLKSYSVSAATP